MLSLDLLPEPYLQLAVMISLTVVLGGLGFLFMISFLKNSVPVLPVEYFGRALAVGIALIVLLVSGLNFFGIPLTKNTLSIAILSGCGISLIRLFYKKPKLQVTLSFSRKQDLIETLIPLSLFFILIFFRVIQIKGILVPNWYDGLFHATLLQEFATKSAIPFNHNYQIGFHTITLMVHSFWGLSFPQTILLSGQWLSIVCGISFYIFARRYIRHSYASGLSFVIYSFVLLFPSLLISWSRYPTLLGLALLPVAILTSQDWINRRKSSLLEPLILVISLNLTHYGLVLIWFSFILVYLIKKIFFQRESRPQILRQGRRAFFRPFSLLFPASIVMLSNLYDPSNHEIIQNSMLSQFFDADLGFGTQYVLTLFRSHDTFFIFLWTFWVLWSLVWSRRLLYVTLFWPLAIWFMIWIQYQIIGNSILTYVNLIVLFSIPLSLSIGLFAEQLFLLLNKLDTSDSLPSFRQRLKNRWSILLSIAMLVGIFFSPLRIDQKTTLFTNEDMLAMRWIRDHTPKDSGFLIRTISRDNNILIPSDGGGWIPLLTGRRAIIPQTGELYDVCKFSEDHGVNYLYFGRENGHGQFDLRLSDPSMSTYELVYGSPSVEIVALHCS